MPCYFPKQVSWSGKVNASGKRSVVFGGSHDPTSCFYLPCGRCIGCRLARSRMWAVRCMHELQMHDFVGSYLTLTYSPSHLPSDGSVRVRDFQLFMKRYRKWYCEPLRYFHCGEYGDEFGRPHYHAIIFGHSFTDAVLDCYSNGHPLFTSRKLDSLWGQGKSWIGGVSFDSAAYIARYVLKKQVSYDHRDGYVDQKPEYITMSNGIGKSWYSRYKSDIYPHGKVIFKGHEYVTPKYYDRMFEKEHPQEYRLMKVKRKLEAFERSGFHPDRIRLAVKLECKRMSIDRLIRPFDKELRA